MKNIQEHIREAVRQHRAGNTAEAEAHYRQVLAIEPGHDRARHLLALIHWDRDHNDMQAAAVVEDTARKNSGSEMMQHNLGSVLGVLGRLEEAASQFRKAIRLKPDYAEAYFNLSNYVKFKPDDPAIDEMRRLLHVRNMSSTDRCFLGFALGKALNDTGEYDEAFRCYEIGNQSAGRKFDPGLLQRRLQELSAVFTQEYFSQRRGWGVADSMPVFIVGMPRSGTTLLEQIIASHPQATGAGEIRDIHVINETLKQRAKDLYGHHALACSHLPLLPPEAYAGMGGNYLQRLAGLAQPDSRIVINKTPENFMHLGLIASMLPGARVLHAVRDPLDTGLSCYFQNFTRGQNFSFDLQNIVHYTRFYRACMQHWKSVLPIKVMDIEYERIAGGNEELLRSVIAFCGLEWDAACLAPQESRRTVRTASSWQVRQPIYSSSVRRWERYRAHLEPLEQLVNAV